MGKLIYIANVSLDGFIEDATGDFGFSVPNDEGFAFITDLIRNLDAFLYGRRLYETMAVWETMPEVAAESELRAEFARVWQAPDKIVYSTTLDAPLTERTAIERTFDPEAVRALKARTNKLAIGGAAITAPALAAGLVDELHLFVAPVLLGAGKPALPNQRIELELFGERSFDNGIVYLAYRVTT